LDNQSINNVEDKIDLIELGHQFWLERRLFLYTFVGIFVFGILLSFILPVEYETSTTLLPESTGSSSRFQVSNLLRTFGGFTDSESGLEGAINKNLYPDYMQSTPFLLKISERNIQISEMDSTVTIFKYFAEIREKPIIESLKKYTIGLPGLLFSLPDRIGQGKVDNSLRGVNDTLKISKIYSLTPKEISIQNEIKERILAELNENGTITITVKMPDPVASAQLAQNSVELLTEFITVYRTEKYKENLEFITQQYLDAKTQFNLAQVQLAEFRDKNANIISARIQTEQQKLETEFQLAADLYRTMAQQLEQAKIKVQEQKPVFTILEPVKIPNRKSEPDRKIIIILSVFLGIFVGFGVVLAKIFYSKLKQKIQLYNRKQELVN
jgi:capsule polysaccharide export protein KpsE/RkpR